MSLLIAMFMFALAMSISPGPANMTTLSSGVNHGLRKTMPYVTGASIGFTLLLVCIGFGFYQVINAYPSFMTYLSMAGSLYIIYIGYKIAASKPEIEVKKKDVPKFHQGFLLQWLNPKAWIACLSGVTSFCNAQNLGLFLTFVGMYFIVCFSSLATWAILGDKASSLLNNNFRLRLFNLTTGMLLIITGGYLGYSQIL